MMFAAVWIFVLFRERGFQNVLVWGEYNNTITEFKMEFQKSIKHTDSSFRNRAQLFIEPAHIVVTVLGCVRLIFYSIGD